MERIPTNLCVSVLGTEYSVKVVKYADDPEFEKRSIDGYCSQLSHEIILCDMDTHPMADTLKTAERRICERSILRHELIHAFLNESGLQDSSVTYDGPWAGNEEMVDWINIQSPKIFALFNALGLL